VLAVVAVLWPRVFAIPIAILSIWFGGAMLLQSYRLRVHGSTASAAVPDTKNDESITSGSPASGASSAAVTP
jgi:hypothetical protein